MNSKFISLAIFMVVIAAVAGFIIFRDLKTTQAPSSGNLAAGQLSEEKTGEADSDKNVEISQSSSIKIPDLKRLVVGSAGNQLPEAIREKTILEIKTLSKELADNHDYISGWLQLGILRKFLGDYDGAVEAWVYASLARPKDYIAFSNLGDLNHYYLKNFPEAEKNLKKVVELKPDNIAGWRNLADLYSYSYPGGETGKEKARAVLQEGLSKNPNNTELKNYLNSL